jgi:hypothetical protein
MLQCVKSLTLTWGLQMGKRYNIQLDEERSARLEALAARTHVQPGTLARSLLSTAIDEADPSPAMITDILNAIPGAYERHQHGRADAREGRTRPLEDL